MEITSNPGDVSALGLQAMAALAATVLSVLLLAAAVRIRVRLPRPPVAPGLLSRVASFVGLALALSGAPARADTRLPIVPPLRKGGAAPPWSDANGFPPPRPFARIGATVARVQTPDTIDTTRGEAHPALHARRAQEPPSPLFPRAPERMDAPARADAMRRHPSGKALASSSATPTGTAKPPTRKYTVREGDTLWSIAQTVLQTEDVARIARFWPSIHRANRYTIGADPNLIFPGQILELPDAGER